MTTPVHLRNGRAAQHLTTHGRGTTWCGKKLIGPPERQEGEVAIFSVYGSDVAVSDDPQSGTCGRCAAAFDAAYQAAFPDGLKPVATFRLDNPDDVERAKAVLSPEALNGFFGPGGGGMGSFVAAIEGHKV